MSIPPAFLDELRARTDLPALLARSVKLQRAGRDWRGCCPFHNEKTPSFYVYADHYHCFGCGAHGDAVRWLTDKQGLPFPEAVKELAAAAGLEVPQPTRAAREKAERAAGLHEVVADAARWFEGQLWGPSGAAARAYLQRRGVSEETARAFGLGLAPEDRTALKRALAKHDERLLVEAGLLIAPEDQSASFDRFRGRLIFPIRDARGRPVGFGGRALGDVKPKYLNSPDTPLFDKGRLLFNLDRAAGAARAAGRLILVEGYMDVIALAEAGIAEAAAPLGTALTEHQLALAWKLVPEPTVCFDGDAAGLKAATKAASRALAMLEPGRSIRIALLPDGYDPDDLRRERGDDALRAALHDPLPLHDYIWRAELSIADTSGPDGRAALLDKLETLGSAIQHQGVRRQYVSVFRDQFYQQFGFRKQQRLDWTKPGAYLRKLTSKVSKDVQGVIVGALRFPSTVSDQLEDFASLPIDKDWLLLVRNAIVESLCEQPDLGPEALEAALQSWGYTELLLRTRATCQPGLPYTWEGPEVDRAVATLRMMLTTLAALERSYVALTSAKRELEAALTLGEDDHATICWNHYATIWWERQRLKLALLDSRDHIPTDARHPVRLRRRTPRNNGKDDDCDGGTGGHGGGNRRAADRHERRRDQEADREGEEARLRHGR